MILVYASEAIFQAAGSSLSLSMPDAVSLTELVSATGAVDAVSSERVLPMLVSYSALLESRCCTPLLTSHTSQTQLLSSCAAFLP